MTATLECELRAALSSLLRARDAARADPPIEWRNTGLHEVASAELSVGRVLHLICGRNDAESQPPRR